MALVNQHPAIARETQNKKSEMPIAESSFLQHVAYDPQNLQMTVTMKNGAQYLYFMVYPQVMENFMQARSKGDFYSKVVRGQHQSTRVVTKSVGKKVSATNQTPRRPTNGS